MISKPKCIVTRSVAVVFKNQYFMQIDLRKVIILVLLGILISTIYFYLIFKHYI